MCEVKDYEAIANWHAQAVFFWRENNETLIEALLDADQAAYQPGSDPAPISPLRVGSRSYDEVRPDGTIAIHLNEPTTFYAPKQHLVVHGHGGIKFIRAD